MASRASINEQNNGSGRFPEKNGRQQTNEKKIEKETSFLNRLDSLDKTLSRPLFMARIPDPIEYILSIPGNWFGSPLFALLVAPCLITMYFIQRHHQTSTTTTSSSNNNTHTATDWWYWSSLVYFLLLAVKSIWIMVLIGRSKAFIHLFYGPVFGTIAPLIAVGIISSSPINNIIPIEIGYFTIASWCAAVIPAAILKPWVSRRRPASWCLEGIDHVYIHEASQRKFLCILPRLFTKDACASFPSGDTAGALAIVYPLLRCGDSTDQLIACAFVTLSCVGRMYWLAHHLGDVVMGVVTAIPCCWLLENILKYVLIDYSSTITEGNGIANNNTNTCACRASEWWIPLLVHLLMITIVLINRFASKSELFYSGTIKVHSE